MAFVSGSPLPVLTSAVSANKCSVRMSAENQAISRRAMLVSSMSVLLGMTVVANQAQAATARPDLSLEEIRKMEKSLKYEDELIQNPDPAEKQMLDYKPKVVPSYKSKEKSLLERENAQYDKIVNQEATQNKELFERFKSYIK
mmetsp:Transcript_16954/g.29670  ORF Transcript_16954/g.29670 Transcript_16954/m.29670 type:complete len:143 (+) Transcript_16954:176-604(+)|eukprot:CAMPEP_0184692226 /NCGR_PEP_ID=MMETSP0313-20130426/792_1 /TAXON_ID=2792 /ORGANISM="Porphyridium aerugineum, Strain SAG 1380-2" /LENGTH=142 /DNA_ID=CAMNT_0027150041 /DNA_START=114 /DNA_END=542 /DNA_ORIENTATION=-